MTSVMTSFGNPMNPRQRSAPIGTTVRGIFSHDPVPYFSGKNTNLGECPFHFLRPALKRKLLMSSRLYHASCFIIVLKIKLSRFILVLTLCKKSFRSKAEALFYLKRKILINIYPKKQKRQNLRSGQTGSRFLAELH